MRILEQISMNCFPEEKQALLAQVKHHQAFSKCFVG